MLKSFTICQLLKCPNDATCIWNANRLHSQSHSHLHSHSKWWFISVHCFISHKWKRSELKKKTEKERKKQKHYLYSSSWNTSANEIFAHEWNINAAGRKKKKKKKSAGWKQVKIEMIFFFFVLSFFAIAFKVYTKMDRVFNRTSGEHQSVYTVYCESCCGW